MLLGSGSHGGQPKAFPAPRLSLLSHVPIAVSSSSLLIASIIEWTRRIVKSRISMQAISFVHTCNFFSPVIQLYQRHRLAVRPWCSKCFSTQPASVGQLGAGYFIKVTINVRTAITRDNHSYSVMLPPPFFRAKTTRQTVLENSISQFLPSWKHGGFSMPILKGGECI